MLRLLTDFGEFRKGECFIPESCFPVMGGYLYKRLMRVPDRRRMCVREERVVELFEDVPNSTVVNGHVFVDCVDVPDRGGADGE